MQFKNLSSCEIYLPCLSVDFTSCIESQEKGSVFCLCARELGNYRMPEIIKLTMCFHVLKLVFSLKFHGRESRDLNDRVHGISCRYSDKTSKQTYHTFLNTQPIFIKQSAHTS